MITFPRASSIPSMTMGTPSGRSQRKAKARPTDPVEKPVLKLEEEHQQRDPKIARFDSERVYCVVTSKRLDQMVRMKEEQYCW